MIVIVMARKQSKDHSAGQDRELLTINIHNLLLMPEIV